LLQEKGVKLTQVAVASATGLTRQTIAQYQHILGEANTQAPSNVTPWSRVPGNQAMLIMLYIRYQPPRRGSGVDF
ncbi:hypothetical protein, partial [Thiolapillus sp.]